ncbi:MAG: aminoglycoside phosphotransferase family protein [Actinomycetota bacterium]|nr:aminoglycoside phosphotransferase family protein [Actinomycetota bacterium]
MGTRSVLGRADVSDVTLRRIVADSLGRPAVDVVECCAEVAEYDLEALTTAGRYWVRGTARHADGDTPFAFFVKVVQSWSRSPLFQSLPVEMRPSALDSVPWRSEPLVYGSDLGQRLPTGLTLPKAYAIFDLDEDSTALWLEAVDVDPVRWDHARYARGAYLLGRLAASPAVRPLAALGKSDVVRSYAHGRLQGQVLPALRDPGLWQQPLVAASFDPSLRERTSAMVEALPGFLDELDRMPLGTAHGDACARNLLITPGNPDGFTLIDFGFWCSSPLGFDLTQLLLGEVQMGERPASELHDLETGCLESYVRGLRDEGCDVPLGRVRRAHALLLLVFGALSTVPLEHLGAPPRPELVALARERAAVAAFAFDLVDETH